MRTIWILPVLFVCLGCESKPNQVHYIIPNGFRGAFAVKPDDPEGAVLVKEDEHYVVRIPESGVLGFKGYNPFRSYLCTASFANGDEIWVSKRVDDKPQHDQIALWEGNTQAWYENGKAVNLFWSFVGTEEEWKASDNESRYRVGKVLEKTRK